MALNCHEAKKIYQSEALAWAAQHGWVIRAFPNSGMSGVNLFWLMKLTNESTQRLKTRATRRQS